MEGVKDPPVSLSVSQLSIAVADKSKKLLYSVLG